MFNHAFTLLMNAMPMAQTQWPGEELMDQDFKPLVLPTYLRTIREAIFGAAPDRAMLSYRSKQCVLLLEATSVNEHILTLDSRVSYKRGNPHAAWFAPVVERLYGDSAATLAIEGEPAAPDSTGKMNLVYTVTTEGTTATVAQKTDPFLIREINFTFANGRSSLIPLTGSGYSARLSHEDSQQWIVDILSAPQQSLSDVAERLGKLGEPVLLSLFGASTSEDAEPYATFWNLWRTRKDLPMKLAGFLAALIYRLEEVRTR
jgi:hypothetical protein